MEFQDIALLVGLGEREHGRDLQLRHRMFIGMSWDHRLLDGSDAMRFLQRLKENLETWDFSHEVA